MSEKWFGINRKEVQWYPIIDMKKCVSCMACLNKCKKGVFNEDNGKPKVINPYNCVIGCTGCQKVCPENAISHPPKSYLQNLIKRDDFEIGCSCGEKTNG